MAIAFSAGINYADSWPTFDASAGELKAPLVQKDADAEILFSQTKVEDSFNGTSFDVGVTGYVRIKIFTEKGREYARVELPYVGKSARVGDITGRTIKPDGSISELKKDAIFDSTVLKQGGRRIKVKSFSLPDVGIGDIIEYRWREVRPDSTSDHLRLPIQQNLAIREAEYYVKPLSTDIVRYTMKVKVFHGKVAEFKKLNTGFYMTSIHNIPPYKDEPSMPPESEVRSWMLIFYKEIGTGDVESSWKGLSKKTYASFKPRMKPTGEIERVAKELTSGLSDDEAKLRKLFDYTRAHVKNVNTRTASVSSEEREQMKSNRTAADTLKQGLGNGFDVNLVFASLCTAIGYDARVALLSDRGDTFFDPKFTDPYFLNAYDIAVRVGDKWRFFDPATTLVPFNTLRWQEEGVSALVSDPGDAEFVTTPITPAENSVSKRTAKLKLNEEGVLEGDVHMELTGQAASNFRYSHLDESETEREKEIADDFKARLGGSEVTEIKLENAESANGPLIFSYHVSVPGYAQRTGKRLFMQPSFFTAGSKPLFTAAERIHPVYFHFPYSEVDDVSITVPDGYVLDHPEAPSDIDAGGIVQKFAMQLVKGRTLQVHREMKNALIIILPAQYQNLKRLFDAIQKNDTAVLALVQGPAGASK